MGSYRYRSLIEKVYIPFRSLIEALYTLNSPPVVSFNLGNLEIGTTWKLPKLDAGKTKCAIDVTGAIASAGTTLNPKP